MSRLKFSCDGIPERFFFDSLFEKNQQATKNSNYQHANLGDELSKQKIVLWRLVQVLLHKRRVM